MPTVPQAPGAGVRKPARAETASRVDTAVPRTWRGLARLWGFESCAQGGGEGSHRRSTTVDDVGVHEQSVSQRPARRTVRAF
jgi:hypothetical protein